MMIPIQVFAEDGTNTLQADNISIKIRHKIENKDYLSNLNLTFILESENIDDPMPEGSSDGKKEVTINANNDLDFGKISFTEAGTYEYTVSRKPMESLNLDTDDSVYKVLIDVYKDNTAVMIIKKVGDTGKFDKIEYTDTYYDTAVITYHLNGGTIDGSGEDISEEHRLGDEITIMKAPKKKGYKFDYWKGSRHYPGDKYTVTEDHEFSAIYIKEAVGKTDKGVRTGDDLTLLLFGAILFISLLASGAAIKRKE